MINRLVGSNGGSGVARSALRDAVGGRTGRGRASSQHEPTPGVRTGKRYGETSLTARHGQGLSRAIAECR